MGALTARLNRSATTFTPLVVQELARIERDLGGRGALVGLLALTPLTPDLRYVLGMLGDPRYAAKPLADLCAIGSILPGDLLKHLGAAALMAGKIRASQKIGEGIAAVAEDVMRRAAPYEDACTACQGIGSVTPDPSAAQPNPSPGPCGTCRGAGRLLYQPELDRQKLAIEMAQLLPKGGGGINILNQQNTLNAGADTGVGSRTLETLQALTDKILYDRSPDDAGAGLDEAEAAAGAGADAADAAVVEGEITETPAEPGA